MEDLYQEIILEYARRPKNKGLLINYNCEGKGHNPSCGDSGKYLAIYNFQTSILESINFVGEGCAISQAGMSMLGEKVVGKSLEELEKFLPNDIYDMFGVHIGPARALCAMLCYNSLQELIKNIRAISYSSVNI